METDEDDDSQPGDGRKNQTQTQARNKCKEFFMSLTPGSYVRYGTFDDKTPSNGVHSIVLASADENGIWVYECNQDWKCGVDFTYYRYDYIVPTRYDFIHNWVEHDLPSTGTYKNTTYHTVECNNCDGYLRQQHDTSKIRYTYSSHYHHTVRYDCCNHTRSSVPHTGQTAAYYNTSSHTITFTCCGGSEYGTHTEDLEYTYYNVTKHKISAGCCTGYVLGAHKFSNNKCTGCGYIKENSMESIVDNDSLETE